MRNLRLSLIACAVVLVSGCATLDQASSSLSCMLARVTSGAAAGCSGSPATATTAGATPTTAAAPAGDRFTRLQAVLDQEITLAKSLQEDAVDAMQHLAPKLRATAGPVRMQEVNIGDSQSGQSRKMRALESITVSMPLAAKGRPEYTRAMDTLKNLANHLADNRGNAAIVVHQSSADVKAQRVNTATGSTKTSQGSTVNVNKVVDPQQAAGVERYTIQPGEIRGQL